MTKQAVLSRPLIILLLLSRLIIQSLLISYRCSSDQIVVVQSFGNDTIRMHCQKPTICGVSNLKCRYDPMKLQCGGKTNFVSQVDQFSPISRVVQTCCTLTVNKDVQIESHKGNDCFLYDLPDGTNGTSAKALEENDKEGYMLLKNINKISEQFDNYSGYRLRYYMLRQNKPSQLMIKSIERNEAGFRVTICRPQCQISNEKQIIEARKYGTQQKMYVKTQVNQSKHNKSLTNETKANKLAQINQNLTGDAYWIVAAWKRWFHSQWLRWSRFKWIESDSYNETESRNDQNKTAIYPNHGTAIVDLTGESKHIPSNKIIFGM
ncbi:unnamed protein product [Thelazia callipaeda]|uniref:Uncharacterized protein n=1 Tax=Thelazia callipaeda TaxID=103827 RepID=A0A0N5CLV2_THECL|nr:unnamed protein product [Thelazia callipaeda]